MDTVTWTWHQSRSARTLLLQTLLTPWTRVCVDFLPVEAPSPQELAAPRQFSDRVRQVMAGHLQLPLADLSLKDALASRF